MPGLGIIGGLAQMRQNFQAWLLDECQTSQPATGQTNLATVASELRRDAPRLEIKIRVEDRQCASTAEGLRVLPAFLPAARSED